MPKPPEGRRASGQVLGGGRFPRLEFDPPLRGSRLGWGGSPPAPSHLSPVLVSSFPELSLSISSPLPPSSNSSRAPDPFAGVGQGKGAQ